MSPDYIKEIKQIVEKHLVRIGERPTQNGKLEEYVTGFLFVRALLIDYRTECEKERAKLEVMVNVTYKDAYRNSDASNQPQKKIDAQADPEYLKFQSQLRDYQIESDWAKAFQDIFDDAHLTYRKMLGN